MRLQRAVLTLLDAREHLAVRVAGATTVIFAAGDRHGHNTDVPGMITTFTPAGISAAGPALILGAGATACSALAALRGLGGSEATVAVRDLARAADLLAAARRLGMTVRLTEFGGQATTGSWHLLISTVPSRAADIYAERMLHADLVPRAALHAVYHPWPPPLAAAPGQT